MATTYTELLTEIQNFLDNANPNLVAAIPTFVDDAERWFSRHLHTRDMECVSTHPIAPTGVTDDTAGIYDLPADWGGHKSISISGDSLAIHYWQKIPALNDTTQTDNWLLLKYPDLYRYASLMSAEAFLKNDPRIAVWAAKAQAILDEVEAHDEHDLYSGGPLRSRSDRPWVGDGAPGRLEYMVPFDFFDMQIRNTLATSSCAGWFTVTQSNIRIWPKPDISNPTGSPGWTSCP